MLAPFAPTVGPICSEGLDFVPRFARYCSTEIAIETIRGRTAADGEIDCAPIDPLSAVARELAGVIRRADSVGRATEATDGKLRSLVLVEPPFCFWDRSMDRLRQGEALPSHRPVESPAVGT
jgi:hypothetical protein